MADDKRVRGQRGGPQKRFGASDRKPGHKKGSGRGSSPRGGAGGGGGDDKPVLFGLHAVEAALNNPNRTILKLYLTENAERRITEAVAARGVEVTSVSPRDLDKRLGADTVHQGVLLEAEPLIEPGLDEMIAAAGDGPLVVLDQVTDPHNVGAVLRSAAVFGACGLIMTRRNSPPLAGVLAKSASGALEKVPIHLATNLSRAIASLRDGGVLVLGLDGQADEALESQPLSGPLAFAFGAEGKGLRQLTAQNCTTLCTITTSDQLHSLNVSNAAAVTLHTALMRRRST